MLKKEVKKKMETSDTVKVFLSQSERKSKGLFREEDKKFRCQYCVTFFSRHSDCLRHEKNFHNVKVSYKCVLCGESYYSSSELQTHKKTHNYASETFKIVKEAFNGATRTFRLCSDTTSLSDCFSSEVWEEILKICQSEIINKRRAYFTQSVHAVFLKFHEDGDIESKITIVFSSYRKEINISHTSESLGELFYNSYKEIEKRMEDFTENGSGWTLSEIECLDLNFTSINSIRGGCYYNFKPKHRRGLLILKNKDEFCLLYCIVARFHSKSIPLSEREKPESYQPFFKNFNLDNIHFPISIEDITQLEKQNKHLMFKVNVFTEIEGDIYHQRMYNLDENDHESITPVNVLLSEVSDDNGQTFYHYSLIENESKFFAAVYTTKKGQICYSRSVTCAKCIARFSSEEKLKRHETVCKRGGEPCKPLLNFKQTHEKLSFQKPWLQYPHLYTGFVDFESLLVKNEDFSEKCADCQEKKLQDCQHSYTLNLHNHHAINFCLIIIDRYCDVVFEKVYTGEDAATVFLQTLKDIECDIRISCAKNENMIFTEEDEIIFNQCETCHICKFKISQKSDKVRDHCHQTGRFIGAAHNVCNLNRKEKAIVKIFAHNFSGYDSHLIIENLAHPSVTNVSVIPKSGEKFMSVEINNTFTLCDSMMFLTGSLDSLSKSLPKDHQYNLLKQSSLYKKLPSKHFFNILFEKWKYPYEFPQSLDEISGCMQIPPIEKFYNSLSGETITQEDYNNTVKIFNLLKCGNLKEYMEYYCMLDVYLLAEVFTEFRKETLQNFEIDPCNFISLPGMGLQCFLKVSNVDLDYIYNGNSILFTYFANIRFRIIILSFIFYNNLDTFMKNKIVKYVKKL